MLKKLLLVILVLAVLAGAGLFALSRFLKPEWVKAQILPRVEEATGAKLEVGDVRLSVFPRVAVWIDNIRVASAFDASEAVFRAERIEVYPKLASLLQGKVELSAIGFLKPEIMLKKSADGRLNLPHKGSAQSAAPRGGSAPTPFLIGRFVIKDGRFSYSDEGGTAPTRIELDRIDAEVRDISMDRPIRFALKAAFEGPARNLEASGTFGPALAAPADRQLKAAAKLRLDQVNMDELKKKLPALKTLPLSGTPVIGTVSADIASVDFGDAGEIRGVQGQAAVDFQELRLDLFRKPVTHIAATAVMQGDRVTVEEGKASLGEGSILFDTTVERVFSGPGIRFRAGLRNVEVNDATPLEASPRAPSIHGKLNADIVFEGSGRDLSEALSAVSGSGQFEVNDGVLKNVNVLASVFEKLSAIPFVGTRLNDFLSPPHRAIVFQRDMALRLAQSRFTINRGAVTIEQANVQSDAFLISAGGTISAKGSMRLNGGLYIGPALSQEMTGLVPDLGVLNDPYGRMFFPFMVTGRTSKPAVTVDKEFITQKLVASKGGELLSKVLKPGQEAGNQTGNLLQGLIK